MTLAVLLFETQTLWLAHRHNVVQEQPDCKVSDTRSSRPHIGDRPAAELPRSNQSIQEEVRSALLNDGSSRRRGCTGTTVNSSRCRYIGQYEQSALCAIAPVPVAWVQVQLKVCGQIAQFLKVEEQVLTPKVYPYLVDRGGQIQISADWFR